MSIEERILSVARDWAVAQLAKARDTRYVCEHIDNIVRERVPRESWVEYSFAILPAVAECVQRQGMFLPKLILPLGDTKRLGTRDLRFDLERWSELGPRLSAREPPLISLRDPCASDFLDIREQYVRPLRVPSLPAIEECVYYAYYSVRRDAGDLDNAQEFYRRVHIDVYKNTSIPPHLAAVYSELLSPSDEVGQ